MTLRASDEARSLGLKLILVGALAFLIWIPAMLVYALVYERSTRADQVTSEIYELAGGKQTISGPVILAPAIIDTGKVNKEGVAITRTKVVAFTPADLSVAADVQTALRQRSIYQATVYDTDIELTGRFGPLHPPKTSEGTVDVLWDQAVLAIKFASPTSLKGVRDSLTLSVNGKPHTAIFEPGIEILRQGNPENGAYVYNESGVSTALPLTNAEAGLEFSMTLPMAGGGGLYFAPVGEETSVTLNADWADPSFQGAYLPEERTISPGGFSAEWRIPYLARSLPRSFFPAGSLALLDQGKSFGVEFMSATSPYKSVNRALKYALMFLGIVFLTFFLFEATTGARAHPAQYILLGLTQVVFYLLVLALSEHIGFAKAFAGTASATVIVSGLFAATVFHSIFRGLVAFTAFSASYALIYLLMKSEDYALLIGSVTAFAALALTMFVTRNLDWYGAGTSDKDR